MKKIATALFALLFMFMTACSVSVDKGTVSDKRMEEAYTEEVEIMERDCDTKIVKGKSKTKCENEGTGEFETVEHEAQYFVTLEDKDGNDEEHSVSEDVYNSVEVGDPLDLTKQ